MRIRHILISNFRGIRQLDWALPDKSFFCLIRRGDSTKSTILEALRRVFHPQWYLAFDDADFYQCDPANAIRIDVVLGNILDDFRDLGSYGYWLCGWSQQALERPDEMTDIFRAVVFQPLSPSDAPIAGQLCTSLMYHWRGQASQGSGQAPHGAVERVG